MAHMLKLKAQAVPHLVDEYQRDRDPELYRGNIDPSRTHLNYNLRPHDVAQVVRDSIATHEQTAGRQIRSDANVLCDWVVTQPPEVKPEDSRRFFECVATFLEGRYGKENVLGAYVHMDETTPHMHAPVLPMLDGKLQASKVIDRADLRSFHGDLGKAVDKELGYHVSIELDETKQAEKALSKVPNAHLDAAREVLEQQLSQQTEQARLMAEAAEQARDALYKKAKEAAHEVNEIRQEATEARLERDKVQGEVEGLEKKKEGLETQLEHLDVALYGEQIKLDEAKADLSVAKDELKETNDRLEYLRRDEGELEKEIGELREKVEALEAQPISKGFRGDAETLASRGDVGAREQAARERAGELDREFESLGERKERCGSYLRFYKQRNPGLEREKRELEGDVRGLERERGRLEARVSSLEALLSRGLQIVKEIPHTLPRAVREIAERVGCKILDKFEWSIKEGRINRQANREERGQGLDRSEQRQSYSRGRIR